jgi:hypothetical protein
MSSSGCTSVTGTVFKLCATHVASGYYISSPDSENERLGVTGATLNGRHGRRDGESLWGFCTLRYPHGHHCQWNLAQLPSNQLNGTAARLAQLWARSQNRGALRPGENWQRGVRRGNAAIFIQLCLAHSFPNRRVHLVDHPIHESATRRRAWRLSAMV